MAKASLPSIVDGVRSAPGVSHLGAVQPSLFPKRVSTTYPHQVRGADISFVCETSEGGTYYCKDDRNGRAVRLTDWIGTRLAKHLGIATAQCEVIENNAGETYFGSLQHRSTVLAFTADDFLRRPQRGELGQPLTWLGRHLSQLHAVDLFLHNPDRDFSNFVLEREGNSLRLCAIDFAASELSALGTCRFPIAHTRTILVGKLLRHTHGFFEESALEMVDRIAAVPATVVAGFFAEIPADWSTEAQREGICGGWQNDQMQERLAALRAGLKDGSLL
jgi:hypothetical protein